MIANLKAVFDQNSMDSIDLSDLNQSIGSNRRMHKDSFNIAQEQQDRGGSAKLNLIDEELIQATEIS